MASNLFINNCHQQNPTTRPSSGGSIPSFQHRTHATSPASNCGPLPIRFDTSTVPPPLSPSVFAPDSTSSTPQQAVSNVTFDTSSDKPKDGAFYTLDSSSSRSGTATGGLRDLTERRPPHVSSSVFVCSTLTGPPSDGGGGTAHDKAGGQQGPRTRVPPIPPLLHHQCVSTQFQEEDTMGMGGSHWIQFTSSLTEESSSHGTSGAGFQRGSGTTNNYSPRGIEIVSSPLDATRGATPRSVPAAVSQNSTPLDPTHGCSAALEVSGRISATLASPVSANGGRVGLTAATPATTTGTGTGVRTPCFGEVIASPGISTIPRVLSFQRGRNVGSGGFGTVFQAILSDGTLAAVKELKMDMTNLKAIDREVSIMSNLPPHPNCVRYFGSRHSRHHYYIIMEYISGGSIYSLRQSVGRFRESIFQRYAYMVLLGLAHIHSHGIIHRDIKGANVLLDERGCAKIVDFGCCKDLNQNTATQGGGTPLWMAPEVCRGEPATEKSDVWSFGCLCLEMTNHTSLPWKFPAGMTLQGVSYALACATNPPAIPTTLSVMAQDFIACCLRLNVNERLGVTELLNHPFFDQDYFQESEDDADLLVSPEPSMRESLVKRMVKAQNSVDIIADLQMTGRGNDEKFPIRLLPLKSSLLPNNLESNPEAFPNMRTVNEGFHLAVEEEDDEEEDATAEMRKASAPELLGQQLQSGHLPIHLSKKSLAQPAQLQKKPLFVLKAEQHDSVNSYHDSDIDDIIYHAKQDHATTRHNYHFTHSSNSASSFSDEEEDNDSEEDDAPFREESAAPPRNFYTPWAGRTRSTSPPCDPFNGTQVHHHQSKNVSPLSDGAKPLPADSTDTTELKVKRRNTAPPKVPTYMESQPTARLYENARIARLPGGPHHATHGSRRTPPPPTIGIHSGPLTLSEAFIGRSHGAVVTAPRPSRQSSDSSPLMAACNSSLTSTPHNPVSTPRNSSSTPRHPPPTSLTWESGGTDSVSKDFTTARSEVNELLDSTSESGPCSSKPSSGIPRQPANCSGHHSRRRSNLQKWFKGSK